MTGERELSVGEGLMKRDECEAKSMVEDCFELDSLRVSRGALRFEGV